MKKTLVVLTIAFAVCIAGALYAWPNNDKQNDTVAKNENSSSGLAVKAVPMPEVPDYLASVYYDPDDTYLPRVICFCGDIRKARHIIVEKCLYDKPVWEKMTGDKRYQSYSGTFLSDNKENIDKMCKMVPLIKQTVKYDRFEILQYDAAKYITNIKKHPYSTSFSVVRDKGKIIWYMIGEVPEDIAVTKDGRYMIATMYSVFYTDASGKRIVSEMYSGNRHYWPGEETPDDVRILTGNVIRIHYPCGRIEHWKVRLSDEDIEKNMEKYEKVYGSKEKHSGGDNCQLWSNGIYSMLKTNVMWCYYESGEEPVYKDAGLADVSADVSVLRNAAKASAYKKPAVKRNASADGGNTAAGAAKGFFASLFGRIKTFFAAVFA